MNFFTIDFPNIEYVYAPKTFLKLKYII